jgi:hypothetical protein
MKRRNFIKKNMAAIPAAFTGSWLLTACRNHKGKVLDHVDEGFVSLFDGKTLSGWHSEPRLPFPRFPGGPEPDRESEAYKKALSTRGSWKVEDGVIIGGQDPPGSGLGGYLVTDDDFGDFELLVDARPDWPVDTGILIRAGSAGVPGIQVLLDHRKSGGIAGFYGNGLAGYHALPYAFDAKYNESGKPVGLSPEKPETTNEPVTENKKKLLAYAAPVEDFLSAWRWDDWNTFKIRCEGKYPYVTTWINGVKICELDTSKITWPDYDKEEILRRCGSRGHIAFEVHDNDPLLGKDRWWPGAVCRWKNIYIRDIV